MRSRSCRVPRMPLLDPGGRRPVAPDVQQGDIARQVAADVPARPSGAAPPVTSTSQLVSGARRSASRAACPGSESARAGSGSTRPARRRDRDRSRRGRRTTSRPPHPPGGPGPPPRRPPRRRLEVLRVGVRRGARRRGGRSRWLRRVSWYCRTSSWPALAEDRQWTCRRSSPGTYSRSAWKARSLIESWSLGTPSRSLSRPPRDPAGRSGGARAARRRAPTGPRGAAAPSGSVRRCDDRPTGDARPRRRVGDLESSSSAGPATRGQAQPSGAPPPRAHDDRGARHRGHRRAAAGRAAGPATCAPAIGRSGGRRHAGPRRREPRPPGRASDQRAAQQRDHVSRRPASRPVSASGEQRPAGDQRRPAASGRRVEQAAAAAAAPQPRSAGTRHRVEQVGRRRRSTSTPRELRLARRAAAGGRAPGGPASRRPRARRARGRRRRPTSSRPGSAPGSPRADSPSRTCVQLAGRLGQPRDVADQRPVDVHHVGHPAHLARSVGRRRPASTSAARSRTCGAQQQLLGRLGVGVARPTSSSGTGPAAPRAAGRCRPARSGSGWRSP